ncbi:MAG TPA: DUF5683 domain-containing protein [Prolixibacteraceae bacterium]|nr:DUF5683 domain-containing protein [Prolixibacteraceae bacterium]
MHSKKNIKPFKRYGGYFLVILFLTTGFSAFCQKSVPDSIQIIKPKVEHSPRKATIYSAIMPGLGQIYNRKYWKLPIIYGGFVTLGYFINYNNDVYNSYKQAYADIVDNDPFTNSYLDLNISPSLFQDAKVSQLTTALKGAKDNWRRYRDLVIIGTAVFYMANIIDASVDAHFFNFDISDDLTINWTPGPVMCMDNKMIGIHCRITF